MGDTQCHTHSVEPIIKRFLAISQTPLHELFAPLQQNTEHVVPHQPIGQDVADLCPCQSPHQVEFLSINIQQKNVQPNHSKIEIKQKTVQEY